MSGSTISKHYARLASLWPRDPLRPTVSFHSYLRSREAAFSKPTDGAAQDPRIELTNVNALYSLLDDRYRKQFPVSKRLLEPSSNPTYYADLLRELDEAPKRGFVERLVKKWQGMLRFK